MIPIHELLNRIRWDAEFARGSFQLGYYDRSENRVILVPFSEVSFPPDSPEMFQLTDAEGRTHRVPFHREREVYKTFCSRFVSPGPDDATALIRLMALLKFTS